MRRTLPEVEQLIVGAPRAYQPKPQPRGCAVPTRYPPEAAQALADLQTTARGLHPNQHRSDHGISRGTQVVTDEERELHRMQGR